MYTSDKTLELLSEGIETYGFFLGENIPENLINQGASKSDIIVGFTNDFGRIPIGTLISYKAPNKKGTGHPYLNRGEQGVSPIKGIARYSCGILIELEAGTIKPQYCTIQ